MSDVKRKLKDSVFVSLFSEKEELLELYRALHPDDTDITKDDLNLVTINNVVANGVYNDLGFMAKNRLIVLIEAQTTWSPNIVTRLLIYLAKSYYDYIFGNDDIKTAIYGEKVVKLPKPELFVVYTGDRKDYPAELSLRKDIFKNENICIDVIAKVIFVDPSKKDIINQYIMFCQTVNRFMKSETDKRTAVRKAIEYCIKNGYLSDFLSKHKKEVEDMTMALFSQEEITENLIFQSKKEGMQEGELLGRDKKGIQVYLNCISRGMTEKDAQQIAEISDELVAKAKESM